MNVTQITDFKQFVVDKKNDQIARGIQTANLDPTQDPQVLIQTHYSSLNFKDALASEGHPGVVRDFPQVPGIDCVGEVVESAVSEHSVGDLVMVGQAAFGTTAPGGWSQYVQVPADWVFPLPAGLGELDAITLGTAGFTAAGCVEALQRCQVGPDQGKVVVTGATGGVGIFAVMLLAKLGYHVVASSGKPEKTGWLKELGANEVISRTDLVDESDRPLLKGIWAGGVDTVGGKTLATLLRSTQVGGAVAACGVVGGADLPITVYPFILRGVSLCGIDSANTDREHRIKLWQALAGEWQLDRVSDLAKVVKLEHLEAEIQKILGGKIAGRVVVDLRDH